MASATVLETGCPPAQGLAKMLESQLKLIAPYSDIKDAPVSVKINENILNAPRRRTTDPSAADFAKKIASFMYPQSNANDPSSIIQYEKDLTRLRRFVDLQRKRVIEENTKTNEKVRWGPRIVKQGAWNPAKDPVSLKGAPSLPMPVEIADPESLAPFFEHLASGGNANIEAQMNGKDYISALEPYYNTESLEFEKGVVYSDKRMDLCKMVLGPDNIGALMDSLRSNNFITHFLLGNNIIGPHGAKCIADFVQEFPDRMDTWYLAGNCIDADSFGLLVDQWVKSTTTTNIWLKRNPLGPTSAHDIFRLITQTANLTTLDLDQTELGDKGVCELFTELEAFAKPIALRRIYLDAVGVGTKAATAIAAYLMSEHCALDSIYLNNNPLGDAGVVALTSGLKQNKSLCRLMLSSTGVNDDGVIALCESIEKHSRLTTLEIGQSYATEDLKMRYNWITDRSAFAIHNLIAASPKLAYLNIAHCAMTHLGLNTVLDAVITSTNLLFYRATTIWPQSRAASAIRAGQQHVKLAEQASKTLSINVQKVYDEDMSYADFLREEKRWLVNDKTDIRKIDSVYRNRDAGLARRGLKKLDKWWDEDDETLKKVMSAVGPICTRKQKKLEVVEP